MKEVDFGRGAEGGKQGKLIDFFSRNLQKSLTSGGMGHSGYGNGQRW